MHIRIFILLGCLAAFCQNCKNEEDPTYFTSGVDLELLTYLPDSFLCTATKEVPGLGSVSWTANCFAALKNGKWGIGFVTYQDSIDLEARERLTISNIPTQNNIYRLDPPDSTSVFASYSRWLSDGDSLNATWEIDTEKDNYIEVSDMNIANQVVSGKFDIHFKMVVQGSFGYVHSERINFKSGSFIARLAQ